MVQQGTARLGATQMQNINVHIPKLSYEKEDNSRDWLSVMSSVTHCDSQESREQYCSWRKLLELGLENVIWRNRK